MCPRGRGAATAPDARQTTALLFVVDLTNAAPGASGWFELRGAAFAARPAAAN